MSAFTPTRPDRVPPTVLFVGVVCRRKGTLQLARAARLLLERGLTDWRLVVVGGQGPTPEPEYAEIVTEFAAAGLTDSLVGPEHGPQVRDRLRDADIFVLPSFLEGQPIAIIEAMAAGVPVVATAVGAIPDLVRDGVEGRVVEPGNVEALAEALAELITDPTLRVRMGTAIRERAEAAHDLPELSRSLAGLYAAVLAPPSPGSGEPGRAGRGPVVDGSTAMSRRLTGNLRTSVLVGIVVALLLAGAGAFYAFSQQRSWVAESMVVVLPSAELDEATSASYYETLSRGQIVATFAEVAGTQRFEQRAEDQLGLSPAERNVVSTEVTVVPDTAVILIRRRPADAQVAQQVSPDQPRRCRCQYLTGLTQPFRAVTVSSDKGTAETDRDCHRGCWRRPD